MLRDREKSRTGWFLAVQVGRQRCEGNASGQTSRDRAEAFSELGVAPPLAPELISRFRILLIVLIEYVPPKYVVGATTVICSCKITGSSYRSVRRIVRFDLE